MDKEYWNKYYSSKKLLVEPSPFAQFILENYMPTLPVNLLEIGSGNGRDALYFTQNGINVYGIDQSKEAIRSAKENEIEIMGETKTQFIESDFVKYDYSKIQEKIDVVYSRFTIHSIIEKEENELLMKISDLLDQGGRFFIEVRTTKDDLYGVGKKISEYEYKTDHYRRFIDPNLFLMKLIRLNFEINYFIESNGLAPFYNQDPIISRFIATKK